MAAVLDIAINLFGGSGSSGGESARRSSRTNSSGRRSGSSSSRRNGTSSDKKGASKKNDGLVTFTVDVHTEGSMTLGIGVKELGGGAVVVEVRMQ